MRPDEHKQKKSAQYRKKHGIVNDAKQTADVSTDRQAPVADSALGMPRKPQVVASAVSGKDVLTDKDNKVNKSPIKTDNGTNAEHRGKVAPVDGTTSDGCYRRRKVESNWQRYESVEDTTETQRGADFSQLLLTCGDALSQFRFKDEQDWLPPCTDVPRSSDAARVLSIDCESLGAALMCVPLHRRLNIDPSCFQEEQIEKFEADAKICRSVYEKQRVQNQTNPESVMYNSTTLQHNSGVTTSVKADTHFNGVTDDLDVNLKSVFSSSVMTHEDKIIHTGCVDTDNTGGLDDILSQHMISTSTCSVDCDVKTAVGTQEYARDVPPRSIVDGDVNVTSHTDASECKLVDVAGKSCNNILAQCVTEPQPAVPELCNTLTAVAASSGVYVGAKATCVSVAATAKPSITELEDELEMLLAA